MMKSDATEKNQGVDFPVGFHEFHPDQGFNFQLNRWHSLGIARKEDLEEAGKNISDVEEWKDAFLALADLAAAENRLMNAAFYYRAAEFFLTEDTPDKIPIYQNFIRFFGKAFQGIGHTISEAPYGNSSIPTIQMKSSLSINKGTIILHGGYDSYKEE